MKIRIRGQSLRFRLGRSEVAHLARGQTVEESIDLSAVVRQSYALRPANAETISVAADGGRVVVGVPAAQIANWSRSEQVGIDADIAVGAAQSLRVLIEKDFACIDNENGEPQDDAFPNPSATC